MDKPLYALVAEALGCKPVIEGDTWECGDHRCPCPTTLDSDGEEYNDYTIPRYDTDWSAIGPLVEKYRITLYQDADDTSGDWRAFYHANQDYDGLTCADWATDYAVAMSPLVAVCNLILKLGEAGKL